MFALLCTLLCTKWNRLWKDKCWDKLTYNCIYQINLILCWLHLPAEIKVQTGENYRTCEHRNKLHLINQTGQSKTWIETCIEFKKYIECSFWANIHKIYWNFHSIRIISLYETISYNIVQTMSVVINDSSDVLCFDFYLINTTAKFMKEERRTDLMFKLTLCSSVTVEDLNL